jgi:multidrug efflux system outer membrane protein
LLYPIFDRQALRDRAAAADERAQVALVQWQKSVLSAFAEVEDALSSLARERERTQKLGQALDASRRSVALAQELHERGVVDFFQVLDAQAQQLRVESQLVQAQTQTSGRAVALYRSLGGGWEGFEDASLE